MHLDFGGFRELAAAHVDGVKTLVMAGDVVEVVLLRNKSVLATNVLNYLSSLNERYDNVIWVMGNHEHYGNSFIHTKQNIVARCKENGWNNFHVLEKETLEIEDTIFFGATMWTTFRNGNPLSMNECQMYMQDYNYIHVGPGSYQDKIKLTTYDTAAECKRTLVKLKEFAELKTDKKKVVVTHMAPHSKSLDPTYANSLVNDAYYEDVSELILDSDIKLWCHGHCHVNNDYMIGDCRVLSNTRGYFGSEQSAYDYSFKLVEA